MEISNEDFAKIKEMTAEQCISIVIELSSIATHKIAEALGYKAGEPMSSHDFITASLTLMTSLYISHLNKCVIFSDMEKEHMLDTYSAALRHFNDSFIDN